MKDHGWNSAWGAGSPQETLAIVISVRPAFVLVHARQRVLDLPCAGAALNVAAEGPGSGSRGGGRGREHVILTQSLWRLLKCRVWAQ